MLEESAFIGGITQVEIGTDNSVSGGGSSVVVDLNLDLEGVDFTEDIFNTSMSGKIALTNTSGWDGVLGGVQGTEWITLTFNSKQYVDGEEKPYNITQRFKVYKVNQSADILNRFTTYIFYFTTYQFLIDSLKFESHLSNRHIGPIASSSSKNTKSLTDQDYGLVNKIFDVAGFELDIGVQENENPIDIEPTLNWINYVPGYLDDRNTPESTGDGWYLGRDTQGINNNSENSEARPRKIFELLNELAENSVSKENSNAANFLTWHDLKGWHFRSIDSYLRDRQDEVDQVYSFDVQNPESGDDATRIIELNNIKQIDFMDLLNKQALSSKVVYYELNPDEPFAAYYATLPASLGGLQKVIGPSGLDNSIGNTVIESEAVIESSLEYDYLKDRDKWNSVEAYPLIRSEENQFTNYTTPSFLEVPPVYMGQGIGNNSWFDSSSSDLNSDWYGWNNSSFRTVNSFYQTNPHEFFRTKFARQSDLSGEKFRVVHDDIKMPIIEALKEYYMACLQRLYYEHNFVIESGINSLESGEGTLGRGPNQEFCQVCVDREDALEFYLAQLTDIEREEIDYFLDRYSQGDELTYEEIILGIDVPDGLVGNLRRWASQPNYLARFANSFGICTQKQKDRRYDFLGSYSVNGYGAVGSEFFNIRGEMVSSIPVVELDNFPRLSSEYVGQSYPRCENQEPLLPYNGDPVDCETLKEKWNNIPSECGLVTQYLGKEYVSPNIRGVHGDPINWYNSMFWNGYWVNPRFGLPNIRNFRRFFANQDYSRSDRETLKQFFEKDLFIKDFGDSIPTGYRQTSYSYDNYYWYNIAYFGDPSGGASSLFSEVIPSHYIYVEGMDFSESGSQDIPYSVENPNDGEIITIPNGPGSSRSYSRNPEISYADNPNYPLAKNCGIPQLCGHSDVGEETISIPVITSFKAVRTSIIDREYTGIDDIEVEEVSLRWPAEWRRGNPYSISTINSIPLSISNEGLTEYLQQFDSGIQISDLNFGEDFVEEDNRSQPVALTIDKINEIYLNGTYFPNKNLQLYDQSRPIYNAKDWQNFQDCNGTCVGKDNTVTDASKAVEYAKYCSYAWNRYWSTPKEQPIYRRAQIALIQSQEIEIVVPNDMNMSIGKLIRINTPLRSPSTIDPNSLEGKINLVDPISGKYLVTGIRRVFDKNNSSMMRVRLNRDSLPYNPSA